MKVWAEASFGLLGRSPDFLNTVLMAWAESADFFGQRGPQFADNVRNYYKHCRERDLFATHAIVNPQTDRSKGSHEQADQFAHLGVVEETKDGLIVRGAKMLATHGPTADELLVYPEPGIREGAERYVLAFGIPCATKGLKFICREPFDDGTQNAWDHPLGSRFEEPDAVCIFDDVLIPWDRVFLYGDVKIGNAMFGEASIRNNTGHQTAVRKQLNPVSAIHARHACERRALARSHHAVHVAAEGEFIHFRFARTPSPAPAVVARAA